MLLLRALLKFQNKIPSIGIHSQVKTMSSSSRYFLITYKYPPDILERRAPHREAHLKYADQFVKEGKLVMGGPLVNPIDTAVIVYKAGDVQEAEQFVRQDPYVTNGVAEGWKIREWNVVVGGETS